MAATGSDGARRQRLLPADRRTQIIEAATRLIGQRGFWGVSVHDIAAACGITDAGLLHHFGTKDGLLIAVLERRDKVDDDSLAARLGVDPDSLDESVRTLPLAEVCAAVVARNAEQPEIVRLYSVLNAESLTPAHPAHDYFIAREARVIAFFGSAVSDLHPDSTVRGRQVIAMMDGLQLRWLRDPDHVDLFTEWSALFGRLSVRDGRPLRAVARVGDSMRTLEKLLTDRLGDALPGAVAVVARGDDVELAAVGSIDCEGSAPMERDTLFRIASVTKPITAAAVSILLDDGVLALDDPIGRWLPELASPSVVRTPQSRVDDVVPANRAITVEDLLTFRCGWGFPEDFSLPAVQPLFEMGGAPRPDAQPEPDEWIARLAGVPLLDQPGEAFLYNASADISGVLVARATGTSFADFLTERIFAPLGMSRTGFWVPADKLRWLGPLYAPADGGGLGLADPSSSDWTHPPRFASGSGGLISTIDDLLAFARLLLADGAVDGRQLLSRDAVRAMTTNHLTAAQRDGATLFLEGQGWGYGGSVDVDRRDPWTVPGRYGWVGGSGCAWHVVPATGTATILLTQVEMTSPTPPSIMRDFWTYAAA